jgi:hypothetical protein
MTEYIALAKQHLPTIVLLMWFVLLVYYLVRLHFSPTYKKFDLATLVTNSKGEADFEKLRVMVAFVAGTYAFFYLLENDTPAFSTYGQWFLAIAFGHAIGNRMTAKPEPSVTKLAEAP